MIKTNNILEIVEFVKEGILSYNSSAPAEAYMDETAANAFINQFISMIDINAGITLFELSNRLGQELSIYAQLKMGVSDAKLNIREFIDSGELKSLADGAIASGNLIMVQKGGRPVFCKDEFYQRIKRYLENYGREDIEATEIMSVVAKSLSEIVEPLKQKGYIS